MNYKIVASRMSVFRKQNGIPFKHIEAVTGLRYCKVCRLLSGEVAPRLSEFALLCLALGASADELLKADGKWEVIER